MARSYKQAPTKQRGKRVASEQQSPWVNPAAPEAPFHPSAKLAHVKVTPKTVGQQQYQEAIDKYEMVFGVGPAGTGKTYLAVAKAVNWLAKKGNRLVLVRPAVEAGERLGFLPGSMQDKVDPYLRPIYDALHDFMGVELVSGYIDKGIIEVAPLAFMRGRTLKNAFVLLDEAQNTTREQMKMFLTRMGENSKVVITGDMTQIDLPDHRKSGLVHAQKVLDGIEAIHFHEFDDRDIVRHPLVQEICNAYEEFEEE
jgi:phosphate starvation-inducible PhoH-like protein